MSNRFIVIDTSIGNCNAGGVTQEMLTRCSWSVGNYCYQCCIGRDEVNFYFNESISETSYETPVHEFILLISWNKVLSLTKGVNLSSDCGYTRETCTGWLIAHVKWIRETKNLSHDRTMAVRNTYNHAVSMLALEQTIWWKQTSCRPVLDLGSLDDTSTF